MIKHTYKNNRTLFGAVMLPAAFAVFIGCNGSTDSTGDASDADGEDAQETRADADDTASDPGTESIPDAETDGDAREDTGGDMDEDTEPVDPCTYESGGECPPSGFTAAAECEEDEGGCTCVLSGTYSGDLLLTPDVTWVLRDVVAIGDGEAGDGHAATITILPGSLILGERATNGLLAVTMHSRIVARGEAQCPIVFTSDQPVGSRARGDWGGIAINGRAPMNMCAEPPCTFWSPAGGYGGDAEDDDSGILRYVRIEFGGNAENPIIDLNGLTLFGVGSGTAIELVQVHMAGDDGIEFFGGTVDFKRVLVTGAAEDGLDWAYGWRGRGQFFVSQQYDDEGSGGIEGSDSVFQNPPRSHPVLSNLTLTGSVPEEPMTYRLGIDLSEGTAASISCAVVLGREGACLDIDDAITYDNAWDEAEGALSGELTLDYSVMSCDMSYVDDGDPFPPFTLQEFYETLNPGNELAGTETDILTAPFDYADPDFTPVAGGPAASGCTAPDDPFFEGVACKGGVGPDDDWTNAWTTREMN